MNSSMENSSRRETMKKPTAKIRNKILAALVVLMLPGCGEDRSITPSQNETATSAITQLRDLADYHNLLRSHSGKVVMVNFFAARCSRCRAEVAILRRLVDEFAAAPFVLIGVSIDPPAAERELEEFLTAFEVNYAVYQDNGSRIFQSFGLRDIPVAVFHEKNGAQAGIIHGVHELEEFKQIIEKLIGS
jgi:peroxiredoxin